MQDTDLHYSPHTLLPAPEPRTQDPPNGYFYHHVAKHLIRDTVRIMRNGLAIDLDKVEQLELQLATQLNAVHEALAKNPYIISFLETQFKQQVSTLVQEKQAKLKPPTDFLKPFKHSDLVHRSYFMHIFAQQQNLSTPSDLLPSGIAKWPANLVKRLTPSYPVLARLLDGTIKSDHPVAIEAMQLLAQHKADLYNAKYLAFISDPIKVCSDNYPTFNPGSSLQLRQFFAMYGIESENFSKKTNEPTFNRAELERIQKECADEHILDVISQLLEFSNAAIIQNNFIQAFYKYSINGRLYGQYKLLGAKSGRFTSSNPNMLNSPSSKSIFAKPIKQCFTAPPGKVICAIDYAALEDRVIANLTGDINKTILQTDPTLDGHLFHAAIYFRKQFEDILGSLPHRELAIAAKQALDAGNKDIKKYRDLSKNVTFGASLTITQ